MHRRSDRSRPRARATLRDRSGARGARRPAPAPREAPSPVDDGALPIRSTGRGARGVSARAGSAHRQSRARPGRGARGSPPQDPPARSVTRPRWHRPGDRRAPRDRDSRTADGDGRPGARDSRATGVALGSRRSPRDARRARRNREDSSGSRDCDRNGRAVRVGCGLRQLADANDWGQCQAAISRALDLREDGATSTAALLERHLQECDLLLVLDNFEQLVEVAPLVAKTVAAAPGLTVLVTSRISLRVSGESVVPVAPLDSQDAVELFRARAAAAGAPIAEDQLRTAEKICELLDGLPLAIELAAPWLRSLPVDELLRRLEDRLGLLIAGPNDLPERQRTMRATIDWSYDLLLAGRPASSCPAERLRGRLHPRGRGGGLSRRPADEHLKDIFDLNLVGRDGSRYRLLEVVREYAVDRLGADVEVRDRHAAHFLEIAEAAEHGLTGRDQAEWLRRLDDDHGNLLAALAGMRPAERRTSAPASGCTCPLLVHPRPSHPRERSAGRPRFGGGQ